MNSLLTQNTNAETSTETFSEPKEKGTDLSDKEGTSFHNLKTIKKKSTVSGSVVPSDKSVSVSFFERKKVLDAPKKPKGIKKCTIFPWILRMRLSRLKIMVMNQLKSNNTVNFLSHKENILS